MITATFSLAKWYQELSLMAKSALIEIGATVLAIALYLSQTKKISRRLVTIGSPLQAVLLAPLMICCITLAKICIPDKARNCKRYKYYPPEMGC